MKQEINGAWKLYFFEQGSLAVKKPSDLQTAACPCIAASVPGNVELDLSANGYLPQDLFMGLHITEAEKYETYEWWYVTHFQVTETQNLMLRFEGVDCFAEYFVNDVAIGTSDNMYIPHAFNIEHAAHIGENTLAVRIRSAILEANAMPTDVYTLAAGWEPEIPSAYVRKAAHGYGWDIMPRAVSAGIWRKVYLEQKAETNFEQVYLFTQSCSAEQAQMRMAYELRLAQQYVGKPLQITVNGVCEEHTFTYSKTAFFKAGHMEFAVENPKLWWPHGYGKSPLYTVTVTAACNGEVIAEKCFKTGIRTVVLDRTELTDGQNGTFRFLVNNTEIMIKGSNWVPMDPYHSRDAARYAAALELVLDVGCNMLRCWGGNVYEDHAFFDFCDAHGILVWQDFAMACHAYPRTDAFLKQVATEAEVVIKRLRQHPSLALWSGDNECDEAVAALVDPNEAAIVTRKILKDAVINHDFIRPYLPSSPFYSEAVMAAGNNLQQMPERHLWGPRDYFKSDFYKNATAHFVSETGYHGCPAPDSIRRFITAENVWPCENEEWYFHSTDHEKRPHRVALMINQIRQLVGEVPDTLEEFALLSQLSQAEAKKYFIERMRSDRPNRTGVLWWNLLDGWPQMSDAVVDYYYTKKIAYYYIKRCQEPFFICCKENQDSFLPLVACNDTLACMRGSVTVTDGETEEVYFTGDFSVDANQCKVLGRIPMDYSAKKLLLIRWTANGTAGKNHYIAGFVPFDKETYKKWYTIIQSQIL